MKHAVITGGSSGIGLAIAKLLWQRHYHLTLIARDLEKLTSVQTDLIASTPDSAQTIRIDSLDVSNSGAVQKAISNAIETIGDIDLLINCAGICTPGHFIEQSAEIFETTMAVNYFGSLYLTQAVIPHMFCLLYTSPSPRDLSTSRMPSSA